MSAKKLVLSIMSVRQVERQEIGQLIRSGLLFNIEPATMRVAVARLLHDGMLSSVQRGTYVLGPESRGLSDQLGRWHRVSDKTRPWNGGWLAIHTAHLGRSNRKTLRACTRALQLNGYVDVYPGFSIRPDNLSQLFIDHRAELIGIGLDRQAIFTKIKSVLSTDMTDWKHLWSVPQLKHSYSGAIECMQSSLAKLPDLDVTEAARETRVVGQSVIQTINFDPLLPEEIGGVDLFREMVEMMVAYDQVGMERWVEYLARA